MKPFRLGKFFFFGNQNPVLNGSCGFCWIFQGETKPIEKGGAYFKFIVEVF